MSPLSFPADGTNPALTEPNGGNALPPPPRLRVLCVDDNEDAADSLGTLLGMVGCETAVAHDAATALAGAEEFRPQACILDITMPGMNGYELARRLREGPGGGEMLLIALTALGDYDSLERMVDSGFDLYYPKPVAPSLLYVVLNEFVERGRPA
jgi:two-component system, OmpR family, response regulator